MLSRNLTTLAASSFAAIVLAAGTAVAGSSAEAPAAADKQAAAAATTIPGSWAGLPVISSDGKTVGQVMSVGPGQTSKDMTLYVKPTEELGAKSANVQIPQDRAVLEGRTVQLVVSIDDVKKFYVR